MNRSTVRLTFSLLLHYIGLLVRLGLSTSSEVAPLLDQSRHLAASLYGAQWGLEKLYFIGTLLFESNRIEAD